MVSDPEFKQSGAYWSWGNRNSENRKAFVQKVSRQARDDEKARRMWETSAKLVGVECETPVLS